MLHPIPVTTLATAHDGRAVPRTFFTAGHTNTEIGHTGFGGGCCAPIGVVEVRIARVDDQIVIVQKRPERRDLRIHRLARYYRGVKKVPANFKYESSTASTLLTKAT